MKIKEVIQRALNDEAFADELKYKAEDAAKQGVGSEAHIEFLRLFAEDDAELAKMRSPNEGINAFIGTPWKFAITSTVACGTATTTTTTKTVV